MVITFQFEDIHNTLIANTQMKNFAFFFNTLIWPRKRNDPTEKSVKILSLNEIEGCEDINQEHFLQFTSNRLKIRE